MRKLRYITNTGVTNELVAVDENGELWFGELSRTEDKRRVVNWSPINTPKDGAAFSEPQLSFFDKWERDARARIENDIDLAGEAVSVETAGETGTKRSGETVQDSSDERVEDGEGSDTSDGASG